MPPSLLCLNSWKIFWNRDRAQDSAITHDPHIQQRSTLTTQTQEHATQRSTLKTQHTAHPTHSLMCCTYSSHTYQYAAHPDTQILKYTTQIHIWLSNQLQAIYLNANWHNTHHPHNNIRHQPQTQWFGYSPNTHQYKFVFQRYLTFSMHT